MTTQENYHCCPDSDLPPKPLLGPSQPQEYPYYAVKDPEGSILNSTISYTEEVSIFTLREDYGVGKSWIKFKEEGYSLVRVAIVEEPKE